MVMTALRSFRFFCLTFLLPFSLFAQEVILEIEVRDKSSNELIDADVSARPYKGDLVIMGERVAEGRYQIAIELSEDAEYLVAVEKSGYMFANAKTTVQAGIPLQAKSINLSRFEMNVQYQLRNIYFESKSSTLTFEAQKELQKLEKAMKDNALFKIEISGHSDNNGSTDDLMEVSHLRAMAAMVYLESRGIDPSRMKILGYGPQRPVVSNDDEFEGRELNRRVEFRIIEGVK
jgi:outer membrane protein OmpA-like peptidoglycan-associated protein